jgi:hypothetical protein
MMTLKDYAQLATLCKELRMLVEETVEAKYRRLRANAANKASSNWIEKASRTIRKYFAEEILNEIGIDAETRTMIGYF